jgi:anti-anti-sigma regulatory factor
VARRLEKAGREIDPEPIDAQTARVCADFVNDTISRVESERKQLRAMVASPVLGAEVVRFDERPRFAGDAWSKLMREDLENTPAYTLDTTTVIAPERITVETRSALRTAVQSQLDMPSVLVPEIVRIDCSSTGYIDASGLGMLAAIHRYARERNSRIEIFGCDDDLRELFRLTRLDTLFKVEG